MGLFGSENEKALWDLIAILHYVWKAIEKTEPGSLL